MTLPFGIATLPLPDWLPWWVPAVLLIPVLIYLLLALLVPFAVFGVKGRLESIEARLDEIQSEIRALTLRLPAGPGEEYGPARPPPSAATVYYPEPGDPEPERVRLVPPPAAPVRAPRADSRPATRAEPRFGPR